MTSAFEFPGAVFHRLQRTHRQLLDSATQHHAHEAEALRAIVLRMRMHESAVRGGSEDFTVVGGHRCNVSCRLQGAPNGQVYYECPRPHEHPTHMHGTDGSVLHRWSGDVSVCWQTGEPHVCTMVMCNHQVKCDGEVICSLTARFLGVPIASLRETGNTFESGKAMTAYIESNPDIDAIDTQMYAWRMKQPELAEHASAVRVAAEQSTMLMSGPLKRTVDLSVLGGGPRRITVGPDASVPPAKRIATVVQSSSSSSSSSTAPLPRTMPIVAAGPTEDDIRRSFRAHVDLLWNLLDTSYSIDVRNAELLAAQKRVLARCIDRRRTGQSNSLRKVTFETVASIHAEETAHVLEGLEWVRIMASWPQWRSGHIRRVESQRLVDRMWRLWRVIVRSRRFIQNKQPQLYKLIGGALMMLVIDGHQMAVCVNKGTAESKGIRVRKQCSHRDGAVTTSECGHDKQLLTVVSPSTTMTLILSPPGMRQRAHEPACGHVLGTTHAVESYLTSAFDAWQTPGETRALCVGD